MGESPLEEGNQPNKDKTSDECNETWILFPHVHFRHVIAVVSQKFKKQNLVVNFHKWLRLKMLNKASSYIYQ